MVHVKYVYIIIYVYNIMYMCMSRVRIAMKTGMIIYISSVIVNNNSYLTIMVIWCENTHPGW